MGGECAGTEIVSEFGEEIVEVCCSVSFMSCLFHPTERLSPPFLFSPPSSSRAYVRVLILLLLSKNIGLLISDGLNTSAHVDTSGDEKEYIRI